MRAKVLLMTIIILPLPPGSQAAPLHDAAKHGDVAAITAALDAGADVNESDGAATPLYFAVRRGHLEAAGLLIERGADVNAPSQWGPALMPAAGKGKPEFVALLLANGGDPNAQLDGTSVLQLAAEAGCLACVQALVEAGAEVNAQTPDGKTAIHLAKVKGHADVADYLMAHGVVLPKPAPISDRLAAADVEGGKDLFGEDCAGCHNIDPKAGSRVGPNLWGIGRCAPRLPCRT